jgi:hypothetical protein
VHYCQIAQSMYQDQQHIHAPVLGVVCVLCITPPPAALGGQGWVLHIDVPLQMKKGMKKSKVSDLLPSDCHCLHVSHHPPVLCSIV